MSRTNDGYKPTPLPDATTKAYQPSSVHTPLNPQGDVHIICLGRG
jgi:hypothetical protein